MVLSTNKLKPLHVFRLAHGHKAIQTHRCVSGGCFVLHDISLSFYFVVLWDSLLIVFFIVSIEEASVMNVLESIRYFAVVRILCRNHAGARGFVW